MDLGLMKAKHRQAAGLMAKHGIDTWMIQFARETGLRPDPLGYLVGGSVTWPSAFLLNRDGATAAIVGTGDAGTFEAMGAWQEVRGYRDSPKDDLLTVLERWDPKTIGWPRYGDSPDFVIKAGQTFAVEMDLEAPDGAGIVGLEEEVVVTADGARYLSGSPQRELKLLG